MLTFTSYQGRYVGGNTYAAGDVVDYFGEFFIAVTNTTVGVFPTVGGDEWDTTRNKLVMQSGFTDLGPFNDRAVYGAGDVILFNGLQWVAMTSVSGPPARGDGHWAALATENVASDSPYDTIQVVTDASVNLTPGSKTIVATAGTTHTLVLPSLASAQGTTYIFLYKSGATTLSVNAQSGESISGPNDKTSGTKVIVAGETSWYAA